MILKDKELPAYQKRVAHVKYTIAAIRASKLIEHQPEVKYTELILTILECQILEAEYRVLQRATIIGQIKRFFKCRDMIDCQLNGMVTRIDDLHRELKDGMEQAKIFGKTRGDRAPMKKEGRARWTKRLSTVTEGSEGGSVGVGVGDGDGEDVFEDAVESQRVESLATATTVISPPATQIAVAPATTI